MALGKPPITTPRALELRVVAQAIENIRQRIEAIEGVSATTAAQAGETTLRAGQQNISISALRAQLVALATRVDALTTADPELETFRAGSAIAVNTAVYPSGDGAVSQVDPGDPVKVYAVLGVATESAVEGANLVVRKAGVMQIAGAVFEPGGPVYVGVGGLTQFPDYINLAIPVGVATSTDEIDVRPGWPALQHPGVYSEYETFLPATFGLVRDAVTLAQDFNSSGNGLVVKIGPDNVIARAIEAGGNLVVEDGDGVNDNPFIYDTPISELPIRSGGLNGHEAVAVDDGDGTSYQVTVQDIADLAGSGSGSVTSVDITPANGVTATGGPITSSGSITIGLGDITPTSVAASGTVTGSNLSGTNTGDQTITLTGDVTGSGTGSFATTLATVNSNVGSFGSSTAIPSITVNAKGLVTAAGTSAVVAPAGTLTGTTLASNVVTSSLTTVGTIGTGVWQGTAVAANFGGTGFTSYAVGDILYASTTSALSKLADVATGNALISGGVATAPSWGKIGLTTHVSGVLPAANGGTGVANSSNLTLGGALTTSGAFASTFTMTGTTAVTFPTSGTLATTAQLPVGANPSASVGLTAVNGSAATFMRSDGAPALNQNIAPTWTGAHRFDLAVGIGASNSNTTGSMLVVAGAQFNSLLVRSTGTSGGVGSSDIYLGSATSDNSGGVIGYDHTTNRLGLGAGGSVKFTINSSGALGTSGVSFGTAGQLLASAGSSSPATWTSPGANPSASVGLTAVNGSATTFMRSDGAPALSQAISPTWSGTHTFSNYVTGASFIPTSSSAPSNGLFLSAANQLGLSVNSTEALTLDQFGNLHLNDAGNALGLVNNDRKYMVLRGASNQVGVLSLANGTAAQGNNGIIEWYDVGNTSSAALRNAFIFSGSTGVSANNLGSFISFATKADGVSGAGDVRMRIESTGAVRLVNDSQELQIGAGNDLRLYHNGTDSFIENDTGNLVIKVNGELDLEEVSTTTTAPSAGGAGALPATPTGYLTVIINGGTQKIAYY